MLVVEKEETLLKRRELETLCVQLDKNVTNGSAIIITYPHNCDSGRSTKTEKVAVERENFSKSTLAMPNTPSSIRNKPTMTADIFEKPALVNEKMPSPPNGPILSPETTYILENAEKLVENVQKKIVEINHDILLHKENPEIPASQSTIDEDLLHLRQMVASKFQQANNPSKVHNANDHTIFTNSVLQVPEKEINEVPRLLKLLTMLPERCYLETRNEESYYKTVPSYVKRKFLSTDSVKNRFQTSVQYQNASSTKKNEKAAQADETHNKPESSTFQIQTGPSVIIKRRLQIQNMECLHISPDSSVNEPTNVGIYNFQHETSSERNAINQDQIIIESDQEDNTFLEGKNEEKKQMFRKSIVLKNPHELKLSFRNDSKKIVEKLSETNNFSRDKELGSQSPGKIMQGNSIKSPEQCNIENSKAKVFSEFLISLEKGLDYSIASKEVKDSGEIKTYSETFDSDEKSQLEKVKENLIEGQSNDELKNADCKSEKLPYKATIISNERVNLNYKNILRDNVVNPTISKSFCQLDRNSEDSKIEIDDINLEEPSIFDLETVLKRNDEIINNVVHGSDKFLKIISSKLKAYNNLINQENKKVDQTVKLASVTKSKPPEEMKKSSIKICSEEKESDVKLNKASDNILDDIISGTNKFSKFISARSDINNSIINQESVLNSHSINLSSESLSLISSTKNPISQKPLSSHMKKSSSLSSISSNDQYGSELNDFSIKYSSRERNIKLSVPSSERSSKDNFGEKGEKENEKIDEGKSDQIVLMQNKFDNFKTKEGKEFPRSFKNQASNTDEIEKDDGNCEACVSKPLLNSDLSSNNHNIHYSGPFLQRKENDFSEMEIFGHIFESLKHSSAAMKRFITCLFGETEARIENEIIGILRETSVHPTIINKFLLILQTRDKNSQLPMFTTNIGLYLNLSDDSRDSFTLRKQFKDVLEGGKSIVSLNSESNRKLSNDQSSPNDQSNKNENNDKESTQIRLEFDVTAVDKKDLYSDSMLTVTQKEIDLTKSREENKELFVKTSNEIFSLKNQSKIEKVLNGTNTKQLIDETDKEARCNNSLKKSQGINKNLDKVEIKLNNMNSSSDIKLVESVPSVSESSKKVDYSQNFTDSSSTSKDCKSLESHVSLKLSDSFMNKKEGNKETIAEQSDELEIQKKIDDLLNREQCVALSVEKSIRTEIDNLSKERSSEENVRRKRLIRGKTFIIKKNSDLGLNTKVPGRRCSDVNSSLSDSQKESSLKVPLRASGSSERNMESSSEIYSEGEVHLPSSCSYSLGEIRLSEQEKLRLRKPDKDIDDSKAVYSCKKQNSDSSSYMSNSLTRSLGEV